MCGRMAITLPHDAASRLFAANPANDLPEVPDYNVCPTTRIAAVALSEAGRAYRPFRWGFIPHWYKTSTDGPLLINARAETIAEKPAFRAAARARRCLVAAVGFYEWERSDPKKPLPWFVTRADGEPLVMAGIWQDWAPKDDSGPPISTCAIVTTAANADMARIHDRLPLVLGPEDWALWLGEEGHGAARLLRPAQAGVLALRRVGTEVNSNRAKGPGLIAPVAG
ncbi:MAG: SOS response-associated peptidase [Rubellimicrobium sp.]|nr:SOS response-associated peptidase [Rubellimicrobium sp.]